ncbi:response regulator [Pseudoalteromonas sp.]|uniref:response regulator n=1 Tax=Pseudoalteromonas sp. TaxID=53249 RepID=UPI003561D451
MNELTKVAIIDDEELAAKTLADLVEICGFDSYFCCDPSGFFGLVQSINPSVVFIDLKMPDMDGVEVVKQLSKIGFNGQVVLISGEGTPLLS